MWISGKSEGGTVSTLAIAAFHGCLGSFHGMVFQRFYET
jgi:hypothetical protein